MDDQKIRPVVNRIDDGNAGVHCHRDPLDPLRTLHLQTVQRIRVVRKVIDVEQFIEEPDDVRQGDCNRVRW